MAIKHISGWVEVTGPEGPVDPGYGRPGGGWSPVDPGYGRPGWVGHPDNSLPGGGGHPDNSLPGGGAYVWGTLIRWLMRPQVGGGPAKPPGLWPILPVDPAWGVDPPSGPPGNGEWIPIDPGFGKPPIWGILPIDPGFGVGGVPHPDNDLPGHWVPVDPGFGKPVGPCGGERPPHVTGKPLWAYIFEIGPDFGAEPK
jgi:hypothetical protein